MSEAHCPLCDAEVTYMETVYMHIAGKHVHFDRDMRAYICWCGYSYKTFDVLWNHWEVKGGVVAHYLACQLEEPVHG